MSFATSSSLANEQDDPIGARAALAGLLELRSALQLGGIDGRAASGSPAASDNQERPSRCLQWKEALVSEVQVR